MKLTEFLEDYGVEYWTEGKNVSKGFVNVQCPYCDDDSNHLGVRTKDLFTSCWRCGAHNFISTIIRITECSYREAKDIRSALGGEHSPPSKREKKTSSASTVLPQESSTKFTDSHKEFLRGRNFPALKTINRWNLRAVSNQKSRYNWRIIIPIYNDRRLVSFTSRAIGNREPPYLASDPELDRVIYTVKETVYNLDSIPQGGNAILVEGPADVWRLGTGSICIFGTQYTERQILLIMKKKINNLFIMMDSDQAGQKSASKLKRVLAPLCKNLEVIELNESDDPGELTPHDAWLVKNELGIF